MNAYLTSRRKRLLDLSIAIPGSMLFLVALPFLFVAVRLASPGPVLIRQQRIGQYHNPLSVIKIRTMHRDSRPGPVVMHDPRVYPLGRILRSLHVDELPQLWAVLKGQMSIVGPRPLIVREVNQYLDSIPDFADRRYAKPGLTGLAQVTAVWASPERRSSLDAEYVRRASLLLDLSIVGRTMLGPVWRIVITRRERRAHASPQRQAASPRG